MFAHLSVPKVLVLILIQIQISSDYIHVLDIDKRDILKTLIHIQMSADCITC